MEFILTTYNQVAWGEVWLQWHIDYRRKHTFMIYFDRMDMENRKKPHKANKVLFCILTILQANWTTLKLSFSIAFYDLFNLTSMNSLLLSTYFLPF